MLLSQGEKVGPYEILAALGAGGMGEVYGARDGRLERNVAIKILPQSFSSDTDRLRRFEQEARTVAALNHPNILGVYDIGQHQGSPYMVTELLEGETLRERLIGGPLSQRRAIEYASQIAEGLAAAHNKGVVHRDLKPENVFLIKEGRAKILDFGLAKLARADAASTPGEGATATVPVHTMPGMVLGTAGYMSPEQVRGKEVDARSDIFSLGAILYEMVSGQRAFQGESSIETMNAIVKEEPPELAEGDSHINPGLERIIRRCLEKAPERRFQSASDLAFALESLSGSSSGVRLPPAPTRKKFRFSAAAITAASLIVAVLLGVLLGLHLRSKPQPDETFTRLSFRPGTIFSARFAPDAKTIIYTAAFDGQPPDLYTVRSDYLESQPVGIKGAILLAISRQGEMAVLLKASSVGHFTWEGTLAVAPLGSIAARELAEHVTSADWSSDGTKLAIIRHVGNNYRLEYPLGKVLYESDNWIDDARVSPDGTQVAFLLHPPGIDDRGDIAVVDSSGSVRTLSAGWAGEEGLAWTPSGKELWFSANRQGEGGSYSVRAVTLAGKGRWISSQPGSLRIHDISSNGEALVSSDETGLKMDLIPKGSPPRDVAWLNFSWAPVLSRDGSLLALTDQSEYVENNDLVYIRRTDNSPAVRLGEGYADDISPDNQWVVAEDLKGGIVLLPVGAGQSKAFHWDGIHVSRAVFLPDSQKILLAARMASKGRLYVTDILGSPPKPLTGDFASKSFDFLSVSPDGKSFAYQRNGEWVVQSMETGIAKPIPAIDPGEYVVRWSTDNRTVFVVREGQNELMLYRVELDSGKRELWQTLRPAFQVGLVSMQNGYFGCDVDASGRTAAISYDTDLDVLYSAEGMR
jgi:serine/threonine protein kinase/Tol biopolymer transport system component